jgi:lysophospholipase L1-like esterase
MKKWLMGLILIISLSANGIAAWYLWHNYKAANALRLDPLQLQVYAETTLAKPKQVKRVVLFGDSRALSWPQPDILGYEFINRGIGNQTTAQISLRFKQHVAGLKPDIVLIQMGINDLKTIPLFPDQRQAIIKQCKTNIQAALNASQALGSKVLLTTIFPTAETPLERRLIWSEDVKPAIQEVNGFIKTLASKQVAIMDSYSLLKGDNDLIQPSYSRDFLHLNAQGYNELNKALVIQLKQP